LIEKVEEVMIRDQLEEIYTEAKSLLRDEKHQGKETQLIGMDYPKKFT
jgi:hypothetical protein